MLKNTYGKLKSVRGASLIIALLVFLLAALTGTAVFTMATSNVGRYTGAKRQQQAYLNVSSAVKLVRGQLEKFSVDVSCTATSDKTVTTSKHATPNGSDLFGKMGRLLAQCDEFFVAYVQGSLGVSPKQLEEKTIEFTLKTKDSTAIGEVTVSLTVDENLGLTFSFVCDESGGEPYATELRIRLLDTMTTAVRNGDGSTSYSRTVRWDDQHASIEQSRPKNS